MSLLRANLLAPAPIAFALGIVGARLRSGLALPKGAVQGLSAYLLVALGAKGGHALVDAGAGRLGAPIAITLLFGIVTPIACFVVLHRLGRFSVADAGGIAAHYGSVSVVTFTAAAGFVAARSLPSEAYLPALVALMEIPGILVAVGLAARARAGTDLRATVHEVVFGRSSMLLIGGLLIGAAADDAAWRSLEAVVVTPFAGVLVFYLLHLGTQVGDQLHHVRKAGPFLAGFALVAPVVFGGLGVAAASAVGLSVGGAAVFGAMAASASYIAAPAAVTQALPDANPAVALTAALAVTFPFNLAIGIPLYLTLAERLA